MDSCQKDKLGPNRADRRRNLGQRVFARFGTPLILITVLLVVVAWAGFLGWVLIRLLGWLVR